jgi:hypothetical protein
MSMSNLFFLLTSPNFVLLCTDSWRRQTQVGEVCAPMHVDVHKQPTSKKNFAPRSPKFVKLQHSVHSQPHSTYP